MAFEEPWHSVRSTMHHRCSNCTEGKNIESRYRRSGTGGKPLCTTCRELMDKGECYACLRNSA